MSNHYGNLNIFGFLTIGDEASGGYSLPLTITNQGDVLGVNPLGDVDFINLNESPYNFAKLSDIVPASGAPTYFQQLNDTPANFSNSSDLIVTVNEFETDLEFTAPNRIFDRVNQPSHGFNVGDALYTASGSYALALADTNNPEKAEALGVVSRVLDSNTFDITFEGYIGGLNGLISGAVYFLSPLIPGNLTTSKPNGLTIAKPMMVALSDTEAVVVNYVGYVSLANATDAARNFVPSSKTVDSSYYEITQTDYYIRVDTTSNNVNLVLPNSTINENRIYKIKKISNLNVLYINVSGADNILYDTLTTSVEISGFGSIEFISDGSGTWDGI